MEPDAHFGQYQIIRRLGKSMNQVYLAMDTHANRQAALKLIKSSPDALSQLVLESERRGAAIQQSLRALDPRVIEIYDYGDLDGYFYVAMQYVEGRNLSEVLHGDGRLGAYRAARVAAEICGQLAKFHSFRPGDGASACIVHGDIKPSNVHLGPNDTVRLLDFGIAKTLRPDKDHTFHNFGSPSYCSPERLGQSRVDPQADLWAVGVTLYEMLSGAPPYQAEDTRKLERLIQARRPPRALPASCPPPLRAIVSKALSPRQERRYMSAAAFQRDLDAFLDGGETVAEQERRTVWPPNPTVESGPRAEQKRAERERLLRRWRRGLDIGGRVAGAVGCVLAGMALFIGTSYASRYWTASRKLTANLDYAHRALADLNVDWSLYKDLQRQFAFMGANSPVDGLRAPLRAAYAVAGEQVIDGYDRSADPAFGHFEWQKAAVSLARAQELGASDRDTAAKLALARGYVALLSAADPGERAAARGRFMEAAVDAPQWADPHLALARMALYPPAAPDNVLAELSVAERLGYKLGAREMEQRADATRLRDAAIAAAQPPPPPPPPRVVRHKHTRYKPRPRRWR